MGYSSKRRVDVPRVATDEVGSNDLLEKADYWKSSSGISTLADADVLSVLSGHNFDGGTIGLAYTGGACAKDMG